MTEAPTAPPLDPDDPAFVAPGTESTGDAPASTQVDYFGFQAQERYVLPDGKSWIEVKILNEGDKAKFQKRTQRDVVLERGSGNAKFKMDPSEERHELIRASVTDWNLTRNDVPIPFGKRPLDDFLTLANPKVVEDLESFIRKLNPWLAGEMSVEDIDAEIARLEELKKDIQARDAGEEYSSSR